MKEEIIKYLCDNQVSDSDYLSRGGYGGYFINDDDCPLVVYAMIANKLGKSEEEIKEVMLEMRNDGLVELCPAVDSVGKPNGSGWSITEKGVKFAVENKLLPLSLTPLIEKPHEK